MLEAAAGESPTVLDSHVHLWDPGQLAYDWLAGSALDRSFTAPDAQAAFPASVEAIFVEAGTSNQSREEVDWVRGAARAHPWIRGAVAQLPLEDGVKTADLVAGYAEDPFVVGVRRNLQDELPGFTRAPSFRDGVRLLGDAGLPFDACVRNHQLGELWELAAAYPRTTIVLDHLGKPAVGGTGDTVWRRALKDLALLPNTVCKLSGLATETATPDTAPGSEQRYLRTALDVFGPDRCLFGSDWPVMTQATDYRTWLHQVRTALADRTAHEVDAVLRGNATRVYRLESARPRAALR